MHEGTGGARPCRPHLSSYGSFPVCMGTHYLGLNSTRYRPIGANSSKVFGKVPGVGIEPTRPFWSLRILSLLLGILLQRLATATNGFS